MIFEQRSGVCKDIAGMLVTMMRAADLDSYAAMTMAGSRIEEVPADQFNHCVVALKMDDERFVMYDPTWVPFDRSIWSLFETEQHYLIGSPEGETLEQIAYSPPEESPLNIASTVKILADGTVDGTIELTGDGAMDYYLRGMLRWYRRSMTEHQLARMFSSISDGIEILGYEHGELLDFGEPMWWRINYRIPDYALLLDDALEFKSPMMQLTLNNSLLFKAGSIKWPEERRDDVFLYNTQLLNGEETIKFPTGFRAVKPKQSDEIDETYAYFKGESEPAGKTLIIRQTAKIRRRQIQHDGYPGFRKATLEAREYAETVFRAEKGGAK
jgi:hypothetical protein